MLSKLVTQSLGVAGLRIAGTGLSMLTTIVLARLYGPSILGTYAYVVAILSVLGVWVSNGWSTRIIRHVAASGSLDSMATMMNRLATFTALANVVLACGAGFLLIKTMVDLGPLTALREIGPIGLVLLGIVLMSDQVATLRMATLRALDKPIYGQAPEMLVRPIMLGLCLLAFALIPSSLSDVARLFLSMAIAAIFSAILGQILLQRITRFSQAEPVPKAVKVEWFKSVLLLSSSAGLILVNGYIDLLLLGSQVSAAELGFYKAALQIAMLANFGYIALNMLAAQRFSKAVGQNDPGLQSEYAKLLSRLALLCAIPLPVVLWIAGPEIFSFLLGPSFAVSSGPALIVASAYVISSAFGMTRTLLVMRGAEKMVVGATVAALIFNIGLCLMLIPKLGMYGAAIGNAGSLILWNGLLWILCRRLYGIDASAMGLSMNQAKNLSGYADGL